jgi:hypothetical protein
MSTEWIEDVNLSNARPRLRAMLESALQVLQDEDEDEIVKTTTLNAIRQVLSLPALKAKRVEKSMFAAFEPEQDRDAFGRPVVKNATERDSFGRPITSTTVKRDESGRPEGALPWR